LRGDRDVVLEAARASSRSEWALVETLRWVSPKIRDEPLLQKDTVSWNKIAHQGSVAPLCTVSSLKISESKITYRAVMGADGVEVCGDLSMDASIGDLAQELAAHFDSRRIYMVLPGLPLPVSPWLAYDRLEEFVM